MQRMHGLVAALPDKSLRHVHSGRGGYRGASEAMRKPVFPAEESGVFAEEVALAHGRDDACLGLPCDV